MSGLWPEQHILTEDTPLCRLYRDDAHLKLRAPFSTRESAATFHQTTQTEHYGTVTYVA